MQQSMQCNHENGYFLVALLEITIDEFPQSA